MDDTQPEVKVNRFDMSNFPVIELDVESGMIPQCCREGWDNCEHVSKPQRKPKTNIGL